MSISNLSKEGNADATTTFRKRESASGKAGWRAKMDTFIVLFKLRVVFLLVVAATAGAFLAAQGWPGINTLLLTWVTGGMAAAGASALNQYWERKSDASMIRTSSRPLVTGEIANPIWVTFAGLLLILIPSLAVYSFNPALTFWLLTGAFIYVVIYTIWLKPRTLLNVVIGGIAGSAAVLSGSAAAGMWNAPGAVVLALILFLWSPFHFWSLALLYRNDYARADFPMLPAQTSPRGAAAWIMVHTIPTGIAGLALAALPFLGWSYLLPVALITVDLFWRSLNLLQDPSPRNARKVFISSNIYLLVLLVAICIGSILPF
jgi:protoheme IX farnesyltransferase